jgi:Cu/Ag efflux protein CusF
VAVYGTTDLIELDPLKKRKESIMKFNSFITVSAILAACVSAQAQTGTGTAADMSQGEVRKVDKESRKITLKHGEIKNLEMPGMTMVFQVKDPAMLDAVKPGDKVQFKAEKAGGALVITDIQPAK